jgi:predicted PurR-regulated permease PerM
MTQHHFFSSAPHGSRYCYNCIVPPSATPSKPSRPAALAAAIIIVAGLYFGRDVLMPLAVALLLTFLLAPLVHRLEHLRLPRLPAVLIVVAFSFAIIGLIGWVISDQAADLAMKLGTYQSDIEHKIQDIHTSLGHGTWANASRAIDQMAKDVVTTQPAENSGNGSWLTRGTPLNPVMVQLAPSADNSSIFSTMGEALQFVAPMAQMLVIIVFVVFMLTQREDIRDRVIRVIGHGRLSVTTQAIDDATTRISRYLLAQSGINLVYGLVVAAGLSLIHIPNPALWGLICALLRFIPYVGVWIGAIFPIALSMVVPDGFYAARPFFTIGLFVVVEILAANVAEPLLFSTSTGLSPLAILFAAVFWTWLWGGIGLVLSTPLTVLFAVAGKYVPQLSFFHILLGDEPVLTPPERYYQRLLADDAEDAQELLEEFEKNLTREESYDQILIPTLEMAERDQNLQVLDPQRRDFVWQIMKDHVETAAARAPASPESKTPTLPVDRVIRVVCLPAGDFADEIIGLMLTNLLTERGYQASTVSSSPLASERVDAIATLNADLVVVSAMPPGASLHVRYLYKRIRAKFPSVRLLIGLWNTPADQAKLARRIASDPDVRVVALLHDAVNAIHDMAQPLLIAPADDNKRPREKLNAAQTAASS